MAPAPPTGSLVLLAFHYPPMIGPASERAASFARHLPDAAWDPIVVTSRLGLFHRDSRNRPPRVRTLRTPAPEPTKLLRALLRRPADRRDAARGAVFEPLGGPALDRLRRLVRGYVYVPDALAMWIPFAVAGARSALRSAPRPAVLMSTSVPFSAHLAALAVARSEGVPWIAEFRDPWSAIDHRIRPRSRARRWIDARLEARVLDAASGVVVTSELTRDEMVRDHPGLAARCWVVRNGFEPPEGPATPPPGRTMAMELVHAGTVRPEISLEPLLLGIDRVAKVQPGSLRVRIVGPPERWRSAAQGLGTLEWLRLEGVADPATARHAVGAASANILLVPGEVNRQHVAAKLMDYLGARRPVLGLISPTSEMAQLARDYGDLRLVEPYTAPAVSRAVESLLVEHRNGILQRSVDRRRPLSELTRRAQTAKLAAVLESVL
jgi:Glycosyl transferase 4-like domain